MTCHPGVGTGARSLMGIRWAGRRSYTAIEFGADDPRPPGVTRAARWPNSRGRRCLQPCGLQRRGGCAQETNATRVSSCTGERPAAAPQAPRFAPGEWRVAPVRQMNTEAFIDKLAAGLAPVRPHAMRRRIAAGLAGGGVVAAILLLLSLGVRADLSQASHTPQFWLKWAFTAALGCAAFVIAERLGRPDGQVGRSWWGLLAPVLAAFALGVLETMQTPPSLRGQIWLGKTAAQCPIAILALAVPAYVGIVWAYRRFAPTRLRLAGAAAGVLAGAVGASVYVLACPERTAAFLVTWYSLALLATGAVGALAGPRLLRW